MMNVYNDLQQLPAFPNAVLTIGTFDGVHRGHRQILEQLKKEAEAAGGTAVVVTFYPHPKQIIESGKKPLFLLNTPSEKYKLLHQAGINQIVEVPFTREFSEQSAEDYIHNFLVGKFRPHTIIIGYDHRFGRNREGNYQLLKLKSNDCGFRLIEIPEHILKDVTISSTRIREALLTGDIETANEYLGYPYFFHARVIHGDKRGRSIGFPTANLLPDHERKLIPADGVYVVLADVKGIGSFKGMMNIGVRPTVEGSNRTVEVNLFDFDREIYGTSVKISILKKLRDEKKFKSLEELRMQLQKDREVAIKS